MNAFKEASRIEEKGINLVTPYLASIAYGGRVVHFGEHSNHSMLVGVQQYGDFAIQVSEKRFLIVELKVEQRHTGNFFIETWSNKHRLNQGWLYKCTADRLFYLFLDRPDKLYSINIRKLQAWLFETQENNQQRLWQFAEKKQGKYDQKNDTWGVLIPVLRLFNAGIAKTIDMTTKDNGVAA